MTKEITCPECGCIIHLEWKLKEEIEENLNKLGDKLKKKEDVVILDDNELSIMSYAEEYPENWKRICESLDKKSSEKN